MMILLVPFVAMQFSDEVRWAVGDFLIAGLLLFMAGVGITLTMQKIKDKRYRIAAMIIIIFTLGIVWAELAVGMFD